MAGDHGRKLHELPWLYLDSVGQEYGPVPGWTMREWLTLGRFPVGSDLRVRLPEWERHLPLHQLYPDLSTAFVLPPAWPDMYVDGVLQMDEGDAESRPSGVSSTAVGPGSGSTAGYGGISSASKMGSNAGSGEGFGPPPSRSRLASRPGATLPLGSSGGPGKRPESPPAPKPQFVLERLMQEEQLLPPPPPQPSQRQLRELLSQPQEGPPLWEDGQLEGPGLVPGGGGAPQRCRYSQRWAEGRGAPEAAP